MYASPDDIVETLRSHVQSSPVFENRGEFLEILRRAQEDLLNHLVTSSSSKPVRSINLEGLDGVGKTTLAKYLGQLPGFGLIKPIPDDLCLFRPHFDAQEEGIKRKYFTLCNMFNSRQLLCHSERTIWILDRYWPSTIAYKLAHQSNIDLSVLPNPLPWPDYLARPSHIFYLYLNEQKRCERIRSRHTHEPVVAEEEQLASDQEFRERLNAIYQKIEGIELINSDGTIEQIAERILSLFNNQ